MREILFRAQKVDTKEWVYGDLLQLCGGCVIYHGSKTDADVKENIGSVIEFYKNEISIVIPETVGQFTGLTDKNGVMIFDGDLLKNFEYPVTFEDGCFCATIQYDLVRCWLNSDDCNLETLEVIGNIHDKHVL